ncbi:hypothetical protein BMETH_237_2 [methanotrophic bacterial endosymbiont of Bathymodiolus sp.]|nr:hypothetical protein BMETH_237_2 [methanotrophic bacterial endosymbiont of Bathymodiolus sp.]
MVVIWAKRSPSISSSSRGVAPSGSFSRLLIHQSIN